MKGVYSIAEVMDSVTTEGKFTLLHIRPTHFSDSQMRSLKAVATLVRKRGGIATIDEDLKDTIKTINNY